MAMLPEDAPKYTTRTTEMVVLPEDDTLFSERATRVRIVDEGAGEFVEVVQSDHTVSIDPSEWPELRQAIDTMIGLCREGQ